MSDMRATNKRELQLDAISTLLIVAMSVIVALLLFFLSSSGVVLPATMPSGHLPAAAPARRIRAACRRLPVGPAATTARRGHRGDGRGRACSRRARHDLPVPGVLTRGGIEAGLRGRREGHVTRSCTTHRELFRADAAAVIGEDGEHVFIAAGRTGRRGRARAHARRPRGDRQGHPASHPVPRHRRGSGDRGSAASSGRPALRPGGVEAHRALPARSARRAGTDGSHGRTRHRARGVAARGPGAAGGHVARPAVPGRRQATGLLATRGRRGRSRVGDRPEARSAALDAQGPAARGARARRRHDEPTRRGRRCGPHPHRRGVADHPSALARGRRDRQGRQLRPHGPETRSRDITSAWTGPATRSACAERRFRWWRGSSRCARSTTA